MTTPALSFEQAPPISVPYRFFLTAPLFGVLAGGVVALADPDTLASRWSPGTLAATHLVAAGFMLQAMCGALLQFVAVVAGANVWRPRLVAGVVHPLVTAGALVLAAAFLVGEPALFLLAAALFAGGLGVFLVVMALALARTPAAGTSIRVLRVAVLGLLLAFALAATVALALAAPDRARVVGPLLPWIDAHATWGLGGWALMLVIGVSYLVVPMFQLTPAYPAWLARALPAGLLVALGAWTAALALPAAGGLDAWRAPAATAGMLVAASYAAATLWLQAKRRRRLVDVTFLYWRAAMVALLALALSWLASTLLPGAGGWERLPVWLGVLALPGVFMSVIVGMLYKILPFLNWLHLQQQGGTVRTMPNMKQMIPEAAMRGQMRFHLAAVALLLGAVLWPPLALPAGIALVASCLWLQCNLVAAARIYRACAQQLEGVRRATRQAAPSAP